MELRVRFELKADRFQNLKCTPFEQQQALSGCQARFPTISPVPQYSVRTAGIVGRRLHVNVDFDSQREFDANNNLQVWYEGLEDEVLRRVEAGSVRVYRVRAASPPSTTNQNIGGGRAVGCGPGPIRSVDCDVQRAGPFQWELLLEGKDYYVDPSGAWFALAARLDQSDYLAVSYIPVGAAGCGPGGRCVGTVPAAASRDTAVLDTLRLVDDPRPGVTAAHPTFHLL